MWQMLTGASENQKLLEDFPVLLIKVQVVSLFTTNYPLNDYSGLATRVASDL